jgi:hypothetical protein
MQGGAEKREHRDDHRVVFGAEKGKRKSAAFQEPQGNDLIFPLMVPLPREEIVGEEDGQPE